MKPFQSRQATPVPVAANKTATASRLPSGCAAPRVLTSVKTFTPRTNATEGFPVPWRNKQYNEVASAMLVGGKLIEVVRDSRRANKPRDKRGDAVSE